MRATNEEQFANLMQEWMQEVLSTRTPDFKAPAELGEWSVYAGVTYAPGTYTGHTQYTHPWYN